MTTLQPRLVRADTLDLQSHDAPSAKDHTRSPTFTPYQHGPAGPHHREALRYAEESAYNDRKQSPRVSMDETHPNMAGQTHLYDSAEESAEDEQHEHVNGIAQHDADYDHGEGDEAQEDEDEDDDLLDKISSSPSIEDGKYSLPVWPPRSDSMESGASLDFSPVPARGLYSFHPSSVSHENLPSILQDVKSRSTSHQGEYALDRENSIYTRPIDPAVYTGSSDRGKSNMTPNSQSRSFHGWSPNSMDDISKYLLPVDDPLLDGDDCNVKDPRQDGYSDDDEANWVDEEVFYEYGYDSDDDTDDFTFTHDSRFIDSGWGGECLRETEDIDFEFVYALHTFVATVEGQANATKGDTMVLLDDSNSYWWLVRVVKDGSIGYLPAEHIETPTERLARLNKHRNIDLSASMLGDNPEKSKNPLKKAMRRRNAKSVAFAAPTYYEPSLYDYTSDEEGGNMGEEAGDEDHQAQKSQQITTENGAHTEDVHSATTNGIRSVATDDPSSVDGPGSPVKLDAPEPIESQAQQDETIVRSRNGVVRNTDSFFKDDTAETKKISLTPRLLRNDTDSNNSSEPDRSSADTFDKVLGEDKSKDDKKKKEKKGMLSGLFKRSKDKKSGKSETDELLSPDDSLASPRSQESTDSTSAVLTSDKKPGKLQKVPRTSVSPKASPVDVRNQSAASTPTITTTPSVTTPGHSPQISSSTGGPSEANSRETQAPVNDQHRAEQTPNRFPSLTEKRSIFSPITTVLKSSPPQGPENNASVKPVYAKKAKERFAIDASDSDDDSTPTSTQRSLQHRSISPMRESMLREPRPDSAMEVSPIESLVDHNNSYPIAYKVNTPMTEDEEVTTPTDGHTQSDTASTSKPSPSLATHTPSTSRSTPTWSDASLRSYMENDQDIRDLLIIVHDKSNVTPVGPDHPLMGGLFMTERTRLAEMQTQLDSMLTGWISKKNPGLLTK